MRNFHWIFHGIKAMFVVYQNPLTGAWSWGIYLRLCMLRSLVWEVSLVYLPVSSSHFILCCRVWLCGDNCTHFLIDQAHPKREFDCSVILRKLQYSSITRSAYIKLLLTVVGDSSPHNPSQDEAFVITVLPRESIEPI